jgi:hypothetical protein
LGAPEAWRRTGAWPSPATAITLNELRLIAARRRPGRFKKLSIESSPGYRNPLLVDFVAVGFHKSQHAPGSARPSPISDSGNASHFSGRSNFCGTQQSGIVPISQQPTIRLPLLPG